MLDLNNRVAAWGKTSNSINFVLLTLLLQLAYDQSFALAFVLPSQVDATAVTASSAKSLPLAHAEIVPTDDLPSLILSTLNRYVSCARSIIRHYTEDAS